MSNRYPIPPGYTSLGYAVDRAKRILSPDGVPKLLGLLVSGALGAFAVNKKGEISALQPAFWVDKQIETVDSVGLLSSGESRGRPVFLEKDLDEKVPTLPAFSKPGQQTVATTAQPSPVQEALGKNKGGAPTVFSEADFMIEAFRILYEGAPPESEAKFRTMALDAFYKRSGRLPSDAWARPRIRKIVQGLEITFGSAATT